jgi:putative ABC transport system permease protein
MSWLVLLRANLARHPARTLLTALSLILAFTLFGLLQPIRLLFAQGVGSGQDSRLVVGPKHSVADMLPVAHGQRIVALPNVGVVAHMTWFGGTYQDPSNFFAQYAVTPEEFLEINTEIELPFPQAEHFRNERRAAIAGADLAERFGWHIGNTISLTPNIWHNRDGGAWTFELVGIFRSSNESLIGNNGFYFAYPYFDEYRAFGRGTVGTFIANLADAQQTATSIQAIDAEFANSRHETRTQSSDQYVLSFARQLGEVGMMASLILGGVLFTLLILTGHAIARSIRERRQEVAVLRVLGFSPGTLATTLLLESVAITLGAGLIGLAMAYAVALQVEIHIPQVRQLGGLVMTPVVVVQGIALAIAIGLGVAAIPAIRSVRRDLVPALRQEG